MAIDRAKRRRSRLAVAFLDRDLFKPVNDTYEYDQGDALLKGIADRLSNARRAGEFVGRLAGDEFTILAEQINPR
jgi:diguanylate cyclase (GGDEF)-like protein